MPCHVTSAKWPGPRASCRSFNSERRGHSKRMIAPGSQRNLVFLALIFAFGMLSWGGRAQAENWPQWRGPRGNSTSAQADLPLEWSDSQGVLWKAELPE